MQLIDEALWAELLANNPLPDGYDEDPANWPKAWTGSPPVGLYGACIVTAARLWADEMERRLRKRRRRTVGDVAKKAYMVVDRRLGPRYSLSGVMYGAVVGVLANHWVHGEQLLRWYRSEVQLADDR